MTDLKITKESLDSFSKEDPGMHFCLCGMARAVLYCRKGGMDWSDVLNMFAFLMNELDQNPEAVETVINAQIDAVVKKATPEIYKKLKEWKLN